ncbi:MAG: OmpA family protein [Candidatus Margulisbacteria bacterium]|nr:OmpA family protein [Candidatus Margulisiibacteriota bacterium]
MKIYRVVRGTRIYKIVKEMSIYKIILATLLLIGVIVWVYAGLLNIPFTNNQRNSDFDGDGIPNYRDEFPDIPTKAVVDNSGNFLALNLDVNFETDSDVISASYSENIKKFATYLKNHPDQKIEIQGHTDDEMSKLNNNLDLSFRRAYSVAKMLITTYGVPTDQLVVKGYGSLNPLVTNNSEYNRSLNRRIEAVLVK